MRTTSDICILGGGPAGSVLAIRLAQLGHEVCVVERAAFPRRHLGESLSPGALPLLASIGLRPAMASGGFTPVRTVAIHWDQGPQQREDPTSQGLLVDRGHFDQSLLNHARALGVRVFQPATVAEKALRDDGWNLRIETEAGALELRAAFLADATGRAARLRSHRRPTGCRTVALHAYWQGGELPTQPRIKAGEAEWYWGVPLPNGIYNTLIFLDAARFRAARASLLSAGFRALIEHSGLLAGATGARLLGRVFAADATPYLDEESLTLRSIKVGDAALALDPLSSSGVQKAIQTALSGAVVVNTCSANRNWAKRRGAFMATACAKPRTSIANGPPHNTRPWRRNEPAPSGATAPPPRPSPPRRGRPGKSPVRARLRKPRSSCPGTYRLWICPALRARSSRSRPRCNTPRWPAPWLTSATGSWHPSCNACGPA